MIEAGEFIRPAQALGYDFWAGVPCSFLTPFINSVIANDSMQYVSSANEGDAVATASGAVAGGRKAVVMMQNSGLGNAFSPLSSLNWVFRIPVLLIITLRGEPGLGDEPQHELMGQITGQTLDSLGIPWRWFPREANEIGAALEAADSHMQATGRPFAFIMRKGSVAPTRLENSWAAQPQNLPGGSPAAQAGDPGLTRHEALATVVDSSGENDSVVIATTGYTGRELFAIADRPNQLYMVGSMGCASSFALGMSMAVPERRVVVVDGDGAAFMRMGNFATIGAYGGQNFHHLLLDNGVHESTGGQPTVSGAVDFAGVAMSCGYRRSRSATNRQALDAFLAGDEGPSFLQLKVRRGVPPNLPRPDVTPQQVCRRLMDHLGKPAFWKSD